MDKLKFPNLVLLIAKAYVGVWAFSEPLVFLDILPALSTTLRCLYFGSVIIVTIFLILQWKSQRIIHNENLLLKSKKQFITVMQRLPEHPGNTFDFVAGSLNRSHAPRGNASLDAPRPVIRRLG